MRELLTAIGLTAAYQQEVSMRLQMGEGIPSIEMFLNYASPMFLRPLEILRALQAGISFSPMPSNVRLALVQDDGNQLRGGPGRDHRVGGGAQRVYPFRRNPQ